MSTFSTSLANIQKQVGASSAKPLEKESTKKKAKNIYLKAIKPSMLNNQYIDDETGEVSTKFNREFCIKKNSEKQFSHFYQYQKNNGLVWWRKFGNGI